mmetsp:Transcript_20365/g.46756  ORF Transcript_20365/g.46756 Transcript_20365/m.46756 type:complete len:211 (-) Transcript_20365:252-884(-)
MRGGRTRTKTPWYLAINCSSWPPATSTALACFFIYSQPATLLACFIGNVTEGALTLHWHHWVHWATVWGHCTRSCSRCSFCSASCCTSGSRGGISRCGAEAPGVRAFCLTGSPAAATAFTSLLIDAIISAVLPHCVIDVAEPTLALHGDYWVDGAAVWRRRTCRRDCCNYCGIGCIRGICGMGCCLAFSTGLTVPGRGRYRVTLLAIEGL